MQLNNQAYDIMKWVAQIFLPALGTLYFAMAQIWGFPSGEEVVGTIVVVDAFLGTLLGLSSSSYWQSNEKNGGYLTTVGNDPDTGMPHLSMTLNKTPDELLSNRTVTLKVDNPPAPPVVE